MSKALRETLIVLSITALSYLTILHLIIYNVKEADIILSVILILVPLTFSLFFRNIYETLYDYKENNDFKHEIKVLDSYVDIAIMFILINTLFLHLERETFWIALLITGLLLALAIYMMVNVSIRKTAFKYESSGEIKDKQSTKNEAYSPLEVALKLFDYLSVIFKIQIHIIKFISNIIRRMSS